jgi:hypothetical protein
LYNLAIYPICINEGSVESTLPGLVTLAPPRKCARGRESDQLIAFIHITGNTNITPEALDAWMQKKAALFYSAPGSVTSALRLMAEAINNELLDRNLKKAQAGSQVNGSLCLVVMRKEVIYSVVIGQARIFQLTKEGVLEWQDRENHAKGLGVNQAITCMFNQNKLNAGDALLLAPLGSPLWSSETLQNAYGLKAEGIGRRLLNQHPPNLRAAFVELDEGKGIASLNTFFPEQIAGETTGMRAKPSQAESVQDAKPPVDFAAVAEGMDVPLPETGGFVTEPEDNEIVDPIEQQYPVVKTERREDSPAPAARVRNHRTEKPVEKRKPKSIKLPTGEAVSVPRSMYLLLAIAVPIIVVIIAASVYINQGRSQQFTYYYGEGQRYAQEAERTRDDPVMHSFNLQAAMMYLQKANEFGVNEDSKALLTGVQAELDKLQGVVRLAMIPLETDAKLSNVNITQMVAANTDLYLLDSVSGKALHLDLVGDQYVLDEGFDCGPNPNNPINRIGKLVDMIGLPTGNSFGATLFGIDAYGNIEFCIPGESGVVSSLMAPDAGWKEIKAVSMYQNYLYVLDPGNNGVFMYYGQGILFEDTPVLFFDNFIPEMKEAVDIEVYADELYVLRSSGELVECTYSHLKDYKQTECTDPAPFRDTRAGQEAEAVTFSDSQFVQIRMTPAPDASLYLLDAHGNGIYHFSLQRNLQKILQPGFADPEYSPKKTVTSMAFSPGRTVFLAFGNQVFTTRMP